MARTKKSPTTATQAVVTPVSPLPAAGAANKSLELSAAACEALARHFGKIGNRDALTGGAAYQIDLAIAGNVNGAAYEELLSGQLNVGHDSQASSSTGPGAADLLAVVLAKLNTVTREKFLREIVADYRKNGNALPAVDELISAAADATLKAMRASETVTRRGAVKFSPATVVYAK